MQEDLRDLSKQLDITISPKLKEDNYRKLLSLCRCAVLPFFDFTLNSFCSIQDTFATGIPTITNPHQGIVESYKNGAPLHLFHPQRKFSFLDSSSFEEALEEALEHSCDPTQQQLAKKYAQQKLDIYQMMNTIMLEHLHE